MRERRPKGSRGSVAVELAITLPILALLVIGGWVLGYLAYTKAALAMAANRAARDLAAATELYPKLDQAGRAYRYDTGFAESFGLPRWGVRALAMKTQFKEAKGRPPSDHAVVVAVCYRVPFTVPFGLLEREPLQRHLPETGGLQDAVLDVADLIGADGLKDLVQHGEEARRQLEEEVAAWERLRQEMEEAVRQGKEVWAKWEWARDLGRELLDPPRDLTPYRDGLDPDQLEAAVAGLCRPRDELAHQSVVLTARAAYLMQEVYQPDAAAPAKAAGSGKEKGAK